MRTDKGPYEEMEYKLRSMAVEMAECPFWPEGDHREKMDWSDPGGGYFRFFGSCSCGATGPVCETPEEALELWNSRSKPTVVRTVCRPFPLPENHLP